jgi:hypothetical protein
MNNQQLKEQLSREADRTAPAFSPGLHRMIMARFDAEPVHVSIRQSRPIWRSFAPLAAAAVVVAGFGIARFARRPAVAPVPRVAVVPAAAIPSIIPSIIPSMPNPVRSLDAPEVKQWTNARYAEVNRDAADVVAYVARQFDVLPDVR